MSMEFEPRPAAMSKSAKIFLAVALLLVANLIYGIYLVSVYWPTLTRGSAGAGGAGAVSADTRVEIGVAYGTEKERWLNWAAGAFARTPEGANVKINLIPAGSVEGGQMVLRQDQRIHVWSPASNLYTDKFTSDFAASHGSSPIASGKSLARSPMVFVMWEDRYHAFVQRYSGLSFETVEKALNEPAGWKAIASRPDWGVFKFGQTHPNQSNSGLATLVLMAYQFHHKSSDLTLDDVLDLRFQAWLTSLQRAVGGLQHSTARLMKDMVLLGPGSYDAVFVYESVAIDFMSNAQGRWGRLRVVYPERNLWNDNPYYVLNVSWSDAAQRSAAEAFGRFLLDTPAQQQALVHGFRPVNPAVPLTSPDSPFTTYQNFGLSGDTGAICDNPPENVIANTLVRWERASQR